MTIPNSLELPIEIEKVTEQTLESTIRTEKVNNFHYIYNMVTNFLFCKFSFTSI